MNEVTEEQDIEDDLIKANQCKITKEILKERWNELQNNKAKIYCGKCEVEQSDAEHFVRETQHKPTKNQGYSISTPVSVEFKIDFDAEDDEGAVMIIRNRFNKETFVRPLPSTVDSEEDQLKCHRGTFDIEAEEASTSDTDTEQENEFQHIYAHPGYSDLLAVRKSARVRPIRTGDDYDLPRVKESKQKVKKATKVTIEPSKKMYVTTSSSRRTKGRHNSPSTPIPNRKSEESKTQPPQLLEPIDETMEYVEILEELKENEETTTNNQQQEQNIQEEEHHNQEEINNQQQEQNNPIQQVIDEPQNQVPNQVGMTHKEKLRIRRLARNKKLLEATRAQGPQMLSRVTEAQFVDLRATKHAKVEKYKSLVGQSCSHPGTNRVYEVVCLL